MSDKKIELKRAKPRQLLGLKDCGQIMLTCKKCKTDLVVLWVTYGNDQLIKDGGQPITTKTQAMCKICGGESSITEVDGIFHVGIPSDDLFIEPLECDNGIAKFAVDRSNKK